MEYEIKVVYWNQSPVWKTLRNMIYELENTSGNTYKMSQVPILFPVPKDIVEQLINVYSKQVMPKECGVCDKPYWEWTPFRCSLCDKQYDFCQSEHNFASHSHPYCDECEALVCKYCMKSQPLKQVECQLKCKMNHNWVYDCNRCHSDNSNLCMKCFTKLQTCAKCNEVLYFCPIIQNNCQGRDFNLNEIHVKKCGNNE